MEDIKFYKEQYSYGTVKWLREQLTVHPEAKTGKISNVVH